jgi:hypothetical protein
MLKWKSVAVLAMSVGALTWTAVHAQQGTNSPTLTARDYIEIQQLASRYAYALDTGADKGLMYANLFAPDGSFGNLRGREAIAKMAWQHMPEQGPLYVKHFILNHAIEPSPGGVIGKEYVAVMRFGDDGKPSEVNTGGVYHDEYVKTPEGWRFKTRRFVGSRAGAQPAPSQPSLLIDPKPIPAAQTQQKGAKASTLTAEDYLEIQQLVNRYPYALDTGAGDGHMYSNLFTLDGVFGRSIGRDAITKMAWQHMPEQGPLYAKHFIMNHVIEPAPDGATGKQYTVQLAIGESGKPSTIMTGGLYEDVYQKTAAGWRFKVRKFSGVKPLSTPAQPGPSRETEGKPSVAPVPQQNTKAAALTPLDYIEIRQLVSRSAYAVDSSTDNGHAYADLFAPDGVMTNQGRRYQGREELAELARNQRNASPGFHYSTNQLIEPSPEGARGRNYLALIQIGEGKQPSLVNGGGRFEDVYVKTAKGWRFKSRTFTASKTGPQPQLAQAPSAR